MATVTAILMMAVGITASVTSMATTATGAVTASAVRHDVFACVDEDFFGCQIEEVLVAKLITRENLSSDGRELILRVIGSERSVRSA